MYELTVSEEFCAAHAIVVGGQREPVHGHNWRVGVTVSGRHLDAEGLLCDFHALEEVVRTVVAPFMNADLNAVAPFDRMNPTAEHVARHIADRVAAALPSGVAVTCVSVTEAPGCVAAYRPDTP
ncbi:MAG: 6-carboxytetrahydropterin synthase [Phycisphaerales bacterium]|nr:6-carboxytetrahydropterin synthase [Phycisphaerales bacterium]